MLFTKATEAGIQLEKGFILNPKEIKKMKIEENKKHVMEVAHGLNVELTLFPVNSDFHLLIDKLWKGNKISEANMSKAKSELLRASVAIAKAIRDLPEDEEAAKLDLEKRNKVNTLAENFVQNIKDVLGEHIDVHIDIIGYEDDDPEPATSA